MISEYQEKLASLIQDSLRKAFFKGIEMPEVFLEEPGSKTHGDLATNIALRSAKLLKKNPFDIAQDFCPVIQAAVAKSKMNALIDEVSAVRPGFINFRFSKNAACRVVEKILAEGSRYGRSRIGKGKSAQIEFVSANPTGPLSVAHARQAAVGDALAHILRFLGYDAKREYYINDGGNQIAILGQSIFLRACEILGEHVDFPEECYQGEYIRDMAEIFLAQKKIDSLEALKELDAKEFKGFGATYLLNVIKQDLHDFGVDFDIWSYESKIANEKAIKDVLKQLDKQGVLYEHDGALWFRSTDFGDDKDRVVRKSDGTYTYLTPDIAYHKNKYKRGFDKVYNIWGPDHHGYIPRIKAAVQALGYDAGALEVLIVQLATIYRDGQPVSMSTRKGEFISLREVLDEVGKDAARFFFLMRGISAHLDFDLELAKKETAENPVYYIQYGHARTCSVEQKAREAGFRFSTKGLKLLGEPEEIDLIKRLASFDQVLHLCAEQMDVFALVSYLQEIAGCFHRFYDRCRIVDPAQRQLSAERLALLEATRVVLHNGLSLLGVSAPERM